MLESVWGLASGRAWNVWRGQSPAPLAPPMRVLVGARRAFQSPCNWTAGHWKTVVSAGGREHFHPISARGAVNERRRVFFVYTYTIIYIYICIQAHVHNNIVYALLVFFFFLTFSCFSFPGTIIYHHPDGTLSPTTLSHQYHNSRSLCGGDRSRIAHIIHARVIPRRVSAPCARARVACPAENREIIWPRSFPVPRRHRNWRACVRGRPADCRVTFIVTRIDPR